MLIFFQSRKKTSLVGTCSHACMHACRPLKHTTNLIHAVNFMKSFLRAAAPATTAAAAVCPYN